jgi:hypothetical protein
MMTTASLGGVRAKLERANTHIAELRRRLEPIAEAATKSIVREMDGAPSRLLYRVTDVPEIEHVCQTIVGDALYRARTGDMHSPITSTTDFVPLPSASRELPGRRR